MMAVASDVDLLCECGCGTVLEPISTMRTLAAEGRSHAVISTMLACSRSHVSAYLRKPPRRVKGHVPPSAIREHKCQKCGNRFRSQGTPRYCWQRPCEAERFAAHQERWAEYDAGVAERQEAREERQKNVAMQRWLARPWEAQSTIERLRWQMYVDSRAEGYGLLAWAFSIDAPLNSNSDDTFADHLPTASRGETAEEWLEQRSAEHLGAVPREHPARELVDRVLNGEALTQPEQDLLRGAYKDIENRLLLGRPVRVADAMDPMDRGGGLKRGRGSGRHGHKPGGNWPGRKRFEGHNQILEQRDLREVRRTQRVAS